LISQKHSNRHPHNWLFYDTGDFFIEKNKSLYRGVMYDLGAGESPFKHFFLEYVDKYIAVDWTNSYHNTKADIIANLNAPLPIDSEVANTVVSFSVLEHLCEPQTMLNEAFRILKSDGALVLQVPFMWWIHEAPYDYYRYTRFGLQYMLDKAGFSDINIFPQTGFWTTWIIKFNYQSLRLIRGPWPVRKIISLILRGVWAIDQRIAPILDKHWDCDAETAGYFVTARKA